MNIVRDIHSRASDRELVDKLLSGNIVLKYDERYLR